MEREAVVDVAQRGAELARAQLAILVGVPRADDAARRGAVPAGELAQLRRAVTACKIPNGLG